MKTVFAALVLVTGICAPRLAAQMEEGDARKTLAGLRGVFVAVAPLTDDAKAHGVSGEQLQADVEQQVRQGGVPVLTKDDLRRTPGVPYLFVHPTFERSQTTGPFLYQVEIEVLQLVVLSRNPEIFVLARTWNSRGGLGAATEENLAASTKDAVRNMTDQFITAFLDANPQH